MSKTITAKIRFTKGSPRKLREVVRAVKALDPQKAIVFLKSFSQRGAQIILKVYQQALGNAKTNFQISPGDLTVESLQVEEGPRYKRRDVHAHGARFDSGTRHKKLSHVTLKLKTKN